MKPRSEQYEKMISGMLQAFHPGAVFDHFKLRIGFGPLELGFIQIAMVGCLGSYEEKLSCQRL